MKKLVLVASLFATSFAFANNGNKNKEILTSNEVKTDVKQSQEASVKELFDRVEAIYCKVTTKEGTTECYFCNCEKLAKGLSGGSGNGNNGGGNGNAEATAEIGS